MAATLSAAATPHDSGASALTSTSFPVPALTGVDRLLLVKIARTFELTGPIGAVFYGGQALTRIGGLLVGTNHSVEIWALDDAGLTDATDTTLVVGDGTGGSCRWGVVAEPWQDAPQSGLMAALQAAFEGASGSSAAPAVTVDSAPGAVVVGMAMGLGVDAYANAGSIGDTSVAQFPFGQSGNATRGARAFASYAPGAESVALDYTLNASGSWIAVGTSIPPSGAGAMPPADPTDCTATAQAAGVNRVAWMDNADDEAAYIVERAPDSSGSPGAWVELADAVATDAEEFDDTTGAEGTAYWYRVKARGPGGDSNYATAASAVTTRSRPTITWSSPPAGAAVPEGLAIQVAATASDPEDGAVAVTLEESTDGGETWSSIGASPQVRTITTETVFRATATDSESDSRTSTRTVAVGEPVAAGFDAAAFIIHAFGGF